MRTRQYFNSSIDTRKSHLKTKGGNHEVKANIIPFLNILDKCTRTLHIIKRYYDKIDYGSVMSLKPTMKI